MYMHRYLRRHHTYVLIVSCVTRDKLDSTVAEIAASGFNTWNAANFGCLGALDCSCEAACM